MLPKHRAPTPPGEILLEVSMRSVLLGLGLLYLAGAIAEAASPDGFRRVMTERIGDGLLGKLGVSPSPAVVEYYELAPETRRWWTVWTRVLPGVCRVAAAWRSR